MTPRTKRQSSRLLGHINPTPEQIARYLGHHVSVVLRDATGHFYATAGRIVVASAIGVILRDTTDYTESFLPYHEIISISPAVLV